MRTTLICILSAALFGCSSKTPEERAAQTCESTLTAFTMAKAFAEKRLKSPSTAKFSAWSDSTVVYQGNCVHTVQAYVDAQNALGATVRQTFVAKLEYLKTENQWRLHSIKFH